MSAGKRILVVEDDPVFRDLLADWLREAGYVVEPAAEGAAALAAARARPPALVVTDIRMPRMAGTAVIREIARIWTAVPIIAISGHFDAKAGVGREEALALGAALTLAKPFKRLELIDAVLRLAGKPEC